MRAWWLSRTSGPVSGYSRETRSAPSAAARASALGERGEPVQRARSRVRAEPVDVLGEATVDARGHPGGGAGDAKVGHVGEWSSMPLTGAFAAG